MKTCECGCGEPVTKYKWKMGHSLRKHHYEASGASNHNWKGGRYKASNGYVLVKAPDNHPGAFNGGYIYEHVSVAERALGRVLPEQAEVHHVNSIKADNQNTNLVICEDHAYHILLHARTRALNACGDANKQQCKFCRAWDFNLSSLSTRPRVTFHKACERVHTAERKRRCRKMRAQALIDRAEEAAERKADEMREEPYAY